MSEIKNRSLAVFNITDKRNIIICLFAVFTFLLSTVGCFGANWAVQIPYMLILIASVIVATRIAGNVVILYNAEIIPQILR